MFSRFACNLMTIIYIIQTYLVFSLYASCISETAFSLVPISGGIKVVTIGTYRPSSKSDLLFLDQDWLLWEAEELHPPPSASAKLRQPLCLQIQYLYFFRYNLTISSNSIANRNFRKVNMNRISLSRTFLTYDLNRGSWFVWPAKSCENVNICSCKSVWC